MQVNPLCFRGVTLPRDPSASFAEAGQPPSGFCAVWMKMGVKSLWELESSPRTRAFLTQNGEALAERSNHVLAIWT